MNQKWFIAFYAVWIIRINRCTHNAPHTYAIIKILLFEEKRASAAGNKSEIQAALSGTDHTETFG